MRTVGLVAALLATLPQAGAAVDLSMTAVSAPATAPAGGPLSITDTVTATGGATADPIRAC
jgi:hypothetical protein